MSRETILIVDDEAIIAAQLQDTLDALGYTALKPVATGEAAIAAVKARPPDLVLMDIKLAGEMDGITAAGRIQSAADIPIVYLTGYSQDPQLQQAKVTAPYGYLVKPVGERELAATLEMALYKHALDRRLRESEDRYRNLIEMSPDAIAVHQQGKFVYVNPAGVKLMGAKDPQELVGKPILDIVHPAYRDSIVQRIGQTVEGENAPLAEEKFIKFDGTAIDVEVAAMPFTHQGKAATQVVVRDITARKRAEAALREREQRLASIYDTVEDVIFQLAVEKDGRYRFASVNRAFLATTGLTSAQVVGKWVDEVIPEPSLSMVLEKYAAAIREKRIVRWEETSEYPTGRLIGAVSIAPAFDEAGHCTHLVGAVHDITARKRAEEVLAEERNLLRTLTDNIPDAIYFKDTESRFIRINQAHARLFGLSDPAQAVGKTDFDFFTEEHARSAYEDEQAIMRSGQPLVSKEEKETWPDGRTAWVSSTKMPLRDQEGQIVGTFGISRDITERKQAEEALRESSAQFRTLFEASPDAIVLVDPHDRWPILDCNPAACQMNGYTRDELVGQSIDVLNLTPGGPTERAEYMESIRQS
ncbi:MAG: PAS domain S-box protein, partial [Chloroflexi bacterium]|nr:PAS domain S-box protein [Chloroflexota bacterium]